MPEGDTLFRTAAGLRPYLVGRSVTAARAQGPGAVPQVQRLVGQRIDAVESLGKNLLIRFDGGLELRTHLRMNGSWHRYRPGERWRRPPGVLASSSRCQVRWRSASMRRWSNSSSSAPRTSIRRCPGSGQTCSIPTRTSPKPAIDCARPSARRSRSRSRCWTSARSPASATSTRTRCCGSSASRRSPRSATLDDATLDRLIATARRLLRANADADAGRGPERVTTTGDRGAPGPLYVYGRRRTAVPPLPHADPRHPTGHGPAADDLLVPHLPGRTAMTRIEVTCAPTGRRLASARRVDR